MAVSSVKSRKLFRILLTVAAMVLAGGAAGARANYGTETDRIKTVGLEARPNAQVPLDATFRDEAGNTVLLAQLIVNRPVILVPVYYSCPRTCNDTLNDLVRALTDGPKGLTLGKDYDVICISINPEETPELAAAKRKAYLKSLGQPDLVGGWHFLTGEESQIHRVTDAIGFYYMKDDVNGYDHLSAIFMLTPQGRVAATIGGPGFAEPNVSLYNQLINAGRGTSIEPRMISFARSCGLMRFDPKAGRFVHNPWIWAATIGGGLILITVGSFIGSLWIGEYKKARLARASQHDTLPPSSPHSPAAGV